MRLKYYCLFTENNSSLQWFSPIYSQSFGWSGGWGPPPDRLIAAHFVLFVFSTFSPEINNLKFKGPNASFIIRLIEMIFEAVNCEPCNVCVWQFNSNRNIWWICFRRVCCDAKQMTSVNDILATIIAIWVSQQRWNASKIFSWRKETSLSYFVAVSRNLITYLYVGLSAEDLRDHYLRTNFAENAFEVRNNLWKRMRSPAVWFFFANHPIIDWKYFNLLHSAESVNFTEFVSDLSLHTDAR